MKLANQEDHALSPRTAPDISKLIARITDAATNSTEFLRRMQDADDTKYCWWDGQHPDGRKRSEPNCQAEDEVLPWEGASDQRIPVAEMLCNEEALICKAALVAGTAQAQPIDSATDPSLAANLLKVLHHQFKGIMRKNIRDEIDFVLDWRSTYGHAILAIDWVEERQIEEKVISADDLLQMAIEMGLEAAGLPTPEQMQQLADTGAELPPQVQEQGAVVVAQSAEQLQKLLLDPELRERLIAAILAYDPEMEDSEARRVATALQAGEPGIYYRPYVKNARVKWEALQPGVDVIYPSSTKDLQKSPWVARVHWFTREDLMDRATLEEWDEEMLAEVLKHPGTALDLDEAKAKYSWLLSGARVRSKVALDSEEEKNMFQIVECYQRATAMAGAPCVYRTILHWKCPKKALLHESLPELHGNYPLVEFRRERKRKELQSSRGIPELVVTHQNAIKAQHDARTDRTNLIMNPPATVPMNRAQGRFSIGPFAQIPVRRSGTFEWMKPPPMDMDTMAITNDEWKLVNERFGRFSPDVPQPLATLIQQGVVSDFLTDMSEACIMTVQTLQQYMPLEQLQRIVGGDVQWANSREEVQGQFDLQISFDVRDLNIEWLREKLELYTAFVVPNDSEGVIDRAEMTHFIFSAIDPILAQRVVKPKDANAIDEEADELNNIAIMFSGEEPLMKQGQNAALRLTVLKRALDRSPSIQQRVMADETVKKVWEARMKFFQFQLDQQQNAIIGRTGGKQALGK